MFADISIGPTVEPALLDTDQIIRRQAVAQAIAFLHHGPKLFGLWMEGQCRRVAGARCVGGLVRAISIETLDCRLRFGLDAKVA